MYTVTHILTDQEATDLRDDLIEKYPLDPTEPPVEPPIDPEPPIEPPDPIEPPNDEMHNMVFAEVFGSNLELPSSSARPKVYPMEDFQVRKAGGMCMAIKLPAITSDCVLTVSKASSRYGPGGVRHAQFTYHRDFDHPISSQNWGDSSLHVNLDESDSRRTIFLNVRMDDVASFGLQIQPLISI